MNSDLRVGLSVSLLVLGVAGAFCFRVDPVAVDAPAETAEAGEAPRAADGPPPAPVLAEEPAAKPRAKKRRSKPAGPPPPPVPKLAALAPAPAAGPADPAPTVPVEVPKAVEPLPPSEPRTYTVSPGDTLTGIAERELGSHRRYRNIYDANRDLLESPDALRVGMTLRLPGPL